MAKVLIIGASRGIGLETVKAALRGGYNVRAMAHSAANIAKPTQKRSVFPIRFLRQANSAANPTETFSALTQLVAEKER